MGKLCACVLCFLLLAAMPMTAQAPGISEMYALIRAEETNNSKIMWIIHEIADVYGPRVTGTPNLKAADDWAVKTMTSWGLVEHASGAVDFSAAERGNARAGLGEHGAFGGGGYAVPWPTDGDAAGVDAKHERSRHGAGGDAAAAGIGAADRRWI